MSEIPQNPPPLEAGGDPLAGMLPKKSRIGVLIFVGVISLAFMGTALRINWPLPRLAGTPLSEGVRAELNRMPEGINLIVFLGLDGIRKTRFWEEFVPDSIKTSRASMGEPLLDTLAQAADIMLLRDIDTLIYAAIGQEGYEPDYLLIASGALKTEILKPMLLKRGEPRPEGATWRSDDIVRLKPRFFAAIPADGRIVISSRAKLIDDYLYPSNTFAQRDTVLSSMIDIIRFPQHAWMVAGSAEWALAALRGLTATNQALVETGNIANIKKVMLSLDFANGISGQSEWIYQNNTSAFFAGGLINIALGVATRFSSRITEQQRDILRRIEVTQNLESLMIDIEFPQGLLRQLQDQKDGESLIELKN